LQIPADLADSVLMTWDQVGKLPDYGISVGAHTVSHPILSRLPSDTQERELAESKRELERITCRRVLSLAYPFGGEEHFRAETKEIARRLGYQLGFTLNRGANRIASLDQFAIRRILAPADVISFCFRVTLPEFSACQKRNGSGRSSGPITPVL
jgi:peptidoglycan/xylan/chitin deacetylase (PgdA/CDA1 family)